MKTIFKTILLLFCIFSVGCGNKKNIPNHFTLSNDSLIIKTKKVKGNGLFQLGAAGDLNFKDTIQEFPYPIKYPKHIHNIQRYLLKPDWKENTNLHVDIIKGIKDGENVFVVDENDNKDLTDDSIRHYEKFQWSSTQNLIKCMYSISNGKKIIKDSSWLKIGTSKNNLLIGKSEHLTGEFSIKNKNYKVGIIEFRNPISFTYGLDSEITLLVNNGKRKDSISNSDLLKIGEFLSFNKNFYRFATISNNGEFITLVKERDFKNKIGTQKGMIAPSFSVVTTKGDTINSKKLKPKITVIANSCGCGGDIESSQAFYKIKENFKNINILHVDSKIDKKLDGPHIDIENNFNKDFYKNYRMQYCSRICYIIGKDKRIIDKFNITEWKTILPTLIKDKN